MPARRARERVLVGSSGVGPRGPGYRLAGFFRGMLTGARDAVKEAPEIFLLAAMAAIGATGLAVAIVWLWVGR
jgi:hypothetical protein